MKESSTEWRRGETKKMKGRKAQKRKKETTHTHTEYTHKNVYIYIYIFIYRNLYNHYHQQRHHYRTTTILNMNNTDSFLRSILSFPLLSSFLPSCLPYFPLHSPIGRSEPVK